MAAPQKKTLAPTLASPDEPPCCNSCSEMQPDPTWNAARGCWMVTAPWVYSDAGVRCPQHARCFDCEAELEDYELDADADVCEKCQLHRAGGEDPPDPPRCEYDEMPGYEDR